MGNSPDEALAAYKRAAARQQAAEHDVHAASDARALAVLELCESGLTMRAVAAMIGMTAARVQQLVARAKAVRGGVVAGISATEVAPPAPSRAPCASDAQEPRPDGSGLW